MEEILELIHNEFINSEEYDVFLRRLEEEEEYYLEKNWLKGLSIKKKTYICGVIKTFRKNYIFITRWKQLIDIWTFVIRAFSGRLTCIVRLSRILGHFHLWVDKD